MSNGSGSGSGNVVQFGMPPEVLEDLRRSGLEPSDIGARVISMAEMAATKTAAVDGRAPKGYAIPYYDINGQPVQFYRIRLLEWPTGTKEIKYKQPARSQNHIYIPKGFKDRAIKSGYVIITE